MQFSASVFKAWICWCLLFVYCTKLRLTHLVRGLDLASCCLETVIDKLHASISTDQCLYQYPD